MRLHSIFASASLLLPAAILLSGCSANFTPTSIHVDSVGVGVITGNVHGGRQPIIGAHIYVYAASTSGNGGPGIAASTANASTSLLTQVTTGSFPTTADTNGNFFVTTDANGAFNLTGEYSCTTGTQVYLYVLGGNAGAGSSNAAAGELAVLGQCPASQTLATLIPSVTVNEVSTVAAAFALSGYASDATHIGSSGTTLALTGIANAATNAANLYDVSGSLGLNARTTTPVGNGSTPFTKVNTLANVLAACINSTGAASTQCSTLFATATSTGATGGTAPTDTATAAINIAHFPSTTGGSTLFDLIAAIGTPFLPDYGSATSVPDWFMPIVYTGGGLNTGQNSSSIALDSLGNVWISDFATNALTKFSPAGAPLSGSGGFTGGGLAGPIGIAIDASDNVLAGNYQDSSISKLTNAGGATSIFTGASIQSPGNISIDASGNIWVGDYTGSGGVSEIDKNGNELSTGGPFATSPALGTANAIALDASGNIYIANGGGAGYVSKFDPTGGYIATSGNQTVVGGLAYPNGIAIDASGNLWTANGWINVSKLNSSLVPIFTNGISGGGIGTIGHNQFNSNVLGTTGVSIDGAGHAWFSLLNDLVAELASDGTALTNATGIAIGPITPTYPTLLPSGIAVDSAGNVWITSLGTNTLTELLGAAVPVVTPLTPGKLGVRP